MKYNENNLNEIIFHIKFPPLPKLHSDNQEGILEFHEHLKNEFPNLNIEKNKKFKYNADSSGKLDDDNIHEDPIRWILSDDQKEIRISDRELVLTYDGEIYIGLNDFLKDVDLILGELDKYDLKIVNCIGLRYINQIEISNEKLIDEYFNPNLHLKKDEFSKEEFVESLTKTDLIVDDYYLILKYGRFNPDYPNRTSKKDVILDYDCILDYDEEIEYIIANLIKMHKIIIKRFESDIKDKLRKKME